MLLILASLGTPAYAHGGVDDEAPAQTVAVSTGDSINRATESHTFDAVVRFKRGPPNTPATAWLFLADTATSAPVEAATSALALSGPGQVEADFSATQRPGIYTAQVAFPAFGDYAGALTVTTPKTSDLLAVSTFNMDVAPAAATGVSAGLAVAGVAGALALAGAAGVLGIGVGWLIGRRRGAGTAAGVLALGFLGTGTARVWAHGGVDDEGPAAKTTAAAPGGALSLAMESQFLLGLRTQRLLKDAFQDDVEALGRFIARPGDSATLRAPVAGTLVAPSGGFPSPGREVRAGDVLATILETPGSADRASVAQEKAAATTELAEARKALALAERDYAQVPGLLDGISVREQLDRQQSVEVAKVRVASAEAAVAGIGSGVSVTIRAPLSGHLGSATARPGDQVAAGDALFRVIDPAGLWMEARLPERNAIGVIDGASARVESPADPGHMLNATVLDHGQEADPATGTVLVTLAVEAGDSGLRPGMSANAWIGRGAARDALVVPDAAVVDSNGSTLAFVKTGPESFEMRELKLGGRAGDEWEVLAGLSPHERVVTAGTYTLRSLAGR